MDDGGTPGITRRQVIAGIGLTAAGALVIPGGNAAAEPVDVVDDGLGLVAVGNVRLTVIAPGLVRYEYSPSGQFEDRPTMLGHHRQARAAHYRIERAGDTVRIETDAMTLTCPVSRFDADADAPRVELMHSGEKVSPTWLSADYTPELTGTVFLANLEVWTASIPPLPPDNLGGWLRCLDSVRGETSLQPGLLSRDGWFFIDDTQSVLVPDDSEGYVRRRGEQGYRDGYIFVYGDDYKQALADYQTLAGATPLLPRQAFGNWFSRYAPYDEHFYRTELVPKFKSVGASLDVLIIDTDFKEPNSWNGWSWNRRLFADPRGFLSWAHQEKMAVGLNIHPSISGNDSRFEDTSRRAGRTLQPALTPASRFFSALELDVAGALGPSYVWDLGKGEHMESFMRLHDSFEVEGVDFWWLDWIIDESCVGAGPAEIADDAWIARAYGRRPKALANRWLLLARNGASYWDMVGTRPGPWGGHRHTIHFTGDTYSTWETLAFEVVFTHAEGNIGMGYVSHDIGGFKGDTDPERYVRWMQFGAFSPIMRIHSQNIGTPRLPWEFAAPFSDAAAEALRIRSAFVPYLYTAARVMHDTGLPMARGMYLDWPKEKEAYDFRHQYMLGDDLLVAPVVRPRGGGGGVKRIWFPEGKWVNIFDGQAVEGPAVRDVDVNLSDIPVYARAGTTVPTLAAAAPAADSAAPLSLKVITGAGGTSRLYQDDGHSDDHVGNGYSWTTFAWDDAALELTVATTSPGSGAGAPRPAIRRIELIGVDAAPTGVRANGVAVSDGRWRYLPERRTAIAEVGISDTVDRSDLQPPDGGFRSM